MKNFIFVKAGRYQLMVLFVVLTSFAQTAFSQTIQGKVTDENGVPFPGASVTVKGTSKGVITDYDGFYKLILEENSEILTFSFLGYTSSEEAINGRTTINVSLEPDAQSLGEIIVVGYGAEKRSQITGAVASISPESLTRNTAASLDNALQGKVAGVTVTTNSAAPGGGVSVRIRGVGGVGNSEPLYVIDGMPISVGANENSSPLSSINSEDIKSISILKDAASAAIYGSRAANGVVLITTKTGKRNQKPVVKISTKYGVQSISKTYDMMDGETFANYRNLLETNAGRPEVFSNPASFGRGTDWVDAITRTASVSDLQASFSGGTDSGNYFLSLGQYKQDGIVESSSFERISLRLNADKKISDKFKVGSNISISRTKQDAAFGSGSRVGLFSNIAQSTIFYPTIPVYDAEGNFSATPANGFYKPVANPLFLLSQPSFPPINNNFRANLYAEYKMLPNLELRTSGYYTSNNTNSEAFGSIYDLGAAVSTEQSVTKSQRSSFNALIENTLNYRLNIDNHSFSFLLGQSAQSIKSESLFVSGDYTEEGNNIIDEQANALNIVNLIDEQSYLSFFGKMNYSFKGKYLMTAILRRDGSSKFGSNNRWGTFPSASVGWLISEEDFIPKGTALNSLKLRAGWGQVGNDNIANYLSSVVVASGFNYPFGNNNDVISSGFALSGIPNPDIQWETVTQYSIGIDADFLDNRLNLVAEYYNKTQNDMLVPVPQSGVTGISNGQNAGEIVLNIGDLTNSGLEFSANYSGEVGKLSYAVGANITTLNNKINDLPAPINRYSLKGSFLTRTEEGRSLGEFYGFAADGIFQNDAEVAAHATQNAATAPGDIRFKDLNNDNIIDDNDQTFIGNPIPDFAYGFSIGLNYENFDFSLQGNGVQGNDIYNASKVTLIDNSESLNKLNFTPWSPTNTNSTYPRAIDSDPNQNLRNSSYFVEDGSFLRIKTLQLGYSLPQKSLSKLGMSKLRLYGSVQNPFTFTKYSGLDPEVGNAGGSNLVSGVDNFVYPMARIFSIGLNAQF